MWGVTILDKSDFHSNQQVGASESQYISIFVLMNIYMNRILGAFTISVAAPPSISGGCDGTLINSERRLTLTLVQDLSIILHTSSIDPICTADIRKLLRIHKA